MADQHAHLGDLTPDPANLRAHNPRNAVKFGELAERRFPLFYLPPVMGVGGIVLKTTFDDELLMTATSYADYRQSGGERSRGQANSRRETLRRNEYVFDNWHNGRLEKSGYTVRNAPRDGDKEEPPDDWEVYFGELESSAASYQGIRADDDRTLVLRSDEMRPVALICIGDMHFGNKGTRYDLIQRDMDLIEQTDGVFALGMGDYVDNFKVNSKSASGLYGAIEPNPEYQEDWAARRMGMTSKWVGLVDGNHDDRNFQNAGLSSSTIAIAERLGVPAFSQAGVGVQMHVGEQSYLAIAKHNFRGMSGVNKGSEARRMWDEWPWHWENADIVCLAHTHEPHVEIPQRKGRPVVYARSGTYKQSDSYAEHKGYRSGYGPSVFILYPDQHLVVPLPQHAFEENLVIFSQIRDRYCPK